MALRFIDSFDHYATADILEKWTVIISVPTIASASGRNGTGALVCSRRGHGVTVTLGNQQTWIVGAAIYSDIHTARSLISLYDSTTNQANVYLNVDGTLSLRRGTAVLGTTSFALSETQWYFLELKVYIHDTAGTIEVRINEDSKLALSSVDTKASANAFANVVYLGGVESVTGTNDLFWDDLYICDGAGTENNDFLGDVRVVSHLPNGAGNYAQWTPSAGANYENVDDNPPDDDTTYNSSAIAAQKDSFGMSNLPGGLTGTVLGIQTLLNCRKDDAGTRTIRPFWRISSTDYNGTGVNIGDSYKYAIREVSEQNPATAAAWTTGEIDALEAGYELTV